MLTKCNSLTRVQEIRIIGVTIKSVQSIKWDILNPVVFTPREPWRNDIAAMQRRFFYARLAIVLRNEKQFLEN